MLYKKVVFTFFQNLIKWKVFFLFKVINYINDKNLEGISTNTDHWIRIYYIVFSATDAGADYKLLKVEGGVYGPPSAPMEPNTNS